MKISIIFMVINIYLLITYYKKKKITIELLTLVIAFEIFFQIGFALKIKNIYISMNDILMLYLLVYTLLSYGMTKIRVEVIILAVLCILGYLNFLIFPPNYKLFPITGNFDKQFIYRDQLHFVSLTLNNVFRCIIFFVYLLAVSITFKNLKKIELLKLKNNIFNLGKIQLVILMIEFVTKYTNTYLLIFPKFIKIFGENKIYQFGFQRVRDGAYWLQGFCLEPGYVAFGLLIYLLSIPKQRYEKLWIGLGILFLILNRSLTSEVIFSFYILILLSLLKSNKKLKIILYILILIPIILTIVDITPYIKRIENIFSNNSTAKSENIRKYHLILGIEYIIRRPLLGYSLGTTRGLSFVISSLENIGILGTFFWWRLHYKLTRLSIIYSVILILLFVIIGTIENLYGFLIILILLLIRLKKEEITQQLRSVT